MKSIGSSNVRVEEEAWEKLRIIASINKRSINKEIEYLIDQRIREYEEKYGEIEINYDEIDEFMKLENLNKCKNICFDYCKYCPQGVHHEISFMPVSFNEHDSKEEI